MKLTTDTAIFAFCKDNAAAVTVDAPVTLDVVTKDCFSNQLREPEDTIEGLNWDATNPATGPIFVNGAEPGDTLKVTIKKIDVDEKGTVKLDALEATIREDTILVSVMSSFQNRKNGRSPLSWKGSMRLWSIHTPWKPPLRKNWMRF